MKRYYNEELKKFYIEGQTLTFKTDSSTLFSGIPTGEQLLEWGFEEYIEPEPEPVDTTQYEPYPDEVVIKLKALLQDQILEQSDEQALENIELFPTWISKIGETVNVGERLYFDAKLYKVLQQHTVQEIWRPDEVASLYTQVQIESEQGTIDNPIPYSINMELIEGKYYTQDGVLYLCIRALAQSVWDLATLVGNYVEVVE